MNTIKKDKGEFGIGSLIIFIAMIVVAAVTAEVLIQLSYRLQQQAESTSNSAIQDVSMGLKIISLGGYRYNTTWGIREPYRNKIDWITVEVSPIAGSPAINVNDIIIEVNDGNISTNLVFNSTATYDPSVSHPHLGNGQFGAKIIRDMSPLTWNEKTITQGDIVEFFFNATACGLNLVPQSYLLLKIIPKHGVPTLENLMTPSPYTTRYVEMS